MLGFAVGFVAGVSLGVVAGGLLAPSSGESFRESVRRQIDIAKQEAAQAAKATEEDLLALYEEATQ